MAVISNRAFSKDSICVEFMFSNAAAFAVCPGGIRYRITTDQLAQDEIVKIVSSIIFGEVAEIK